MEELVSFSESCSDDNEEKVGNCDLSFNLSKCSSPEISESTLLSLPCLVCGIESLEVAIKVEVNCDYEEDNCINSVDHSEKIFNWFLKWFGVDILKSKKKGRQSQRQNGWDGEGGPPLQFCGNCKGHLGKFLELQIKVEELEKEIREGMGQLKEKMEGCEDILQSSGIYERDSRYKKVRSRIVSNVRNSCEESSQKRKSGRPKKKPVEKQAVELEQTGQGDDDIKNVIPVVLLSSFDKASADQRLLNTDLSAKEDTPNPTLKRPRRLASSKKVKITSDLEDEEEWLPIPKKKKRKPKDDDFIPEDDIDNPQDNPSSDVASHDDDDETEDEDLAEKGKKYLRFKENPSTNQLTYGKFHFTILSNDDPLSPSSSSSSPLTPSVQCLLCNLVFPKNKGIIRHHVLKTHSKKYACPQCSSRFTCQSILNRHTSLVHEGGLPENHRVHKMTTCRICGKPVNKSGLKRHEFSHMNKEEREQAFKSGQVPENFRKRWQCDECGSKFGGHFALKLHKERRHGSGGGKKDDELFELCTQCGGSFKDVKGHMRNAHKQGKVWECLENGCGKKFSILSALTAHKDRVHRKIKQWRCPHCPREFWGEKYYQQHLNNHLGIRPWKCEDCPSDFTAKSALKNHRKIFHEAGSKPKRKSYRRGPTVLGAGVKQEELRRKGEYFPPSALATWAKGREPAEGHVRPLGGRARDGAGEDVEFGGKL